MFNGNTVTVSVVMCTYNGAKFVSEQLESIINQSYPISEIVIQDDCSTDNTMNIINEYTLKYPIIKCFKNGRNMGFNANFEIACERSTGDFVAISDQDDVWFADKIKRQMAAIGSHDICFCCHYRGRERDKSVLVTPQYSLEALLFGGFAGHTMLLRGEFARDKSNWIDYIHYDWSLAINAQLKGGITRIDTPLNWHRTHEGSAIDAEQKRFGKQFGKKLTYQPYIYGVKNYRNLQKKHNWIRLYTYIYKHTSQHNHPLAHRICSLMLRRTMLSLWLLCVLCMRNKNSIYYNGNAKGATGIIRSFAYPLIFAYNNVQYDL